jgi:hypothetical protein
MKVRSLTEDRYESLTEIAVGLPQRGYDLQPRVAALRGYPGKRVF